MQAGLGIPEIGGRLDVAAVVTGAVLWSNDSVRITARVLDAGSERPLWSRTYDRPVRDILRLQQEIVQDITHALGLVGSNVPSQTREVDPATYEAYLRGTYHLNRGTPADIARGIGFLQDAVDRDRGDARAWAALAEGYVTIGHSPAATEDAWVRARAAADHAVKLAPDLAKGHAALAEIKLYHEWDWAGAEAAFGRANELNPNQAMNHYHHAWYLALMGRLEEAIVAHRRAQAIDPLTPLHTGWLAELNRYAGDPKSAAQEIERCFDLSREAAVCWLAAGNLHRDQGRFAEAVEAHQRTLQFNPRYRDALAVSLIAAGRREEAQRLTAEIAAGRMTPFDAWALMAIHAALGDLDQAFKWAAREPPHAWLPGVRVIPGFEGMWADARFTGLLQRMNLPARPGP